VNLPKSETPVTGDLENGLSIYGRFGQKSIQCYVPLQRYFIIAAVPSDETSVEKNKQGTTKLKIDGSLKNWS